MNTIPTEVYEFVRYGSPWPEAWATDNRGNLYILEQAWTSNDAQYVRCRKFKKGSSVSSFVSLSKVPKGIDWKFDYR